MLNVQIVDDHKMLADSLGCMINESNIARTTDVYYDLNSCRLGLAKALPDVLLLDVKFPPDGDGVDFCAEIKKRYPELKIIMLTSYKEFSIAKRALHNGAVGYILKNAMSEEFFAGIEAVSKGEMFLCEEIDILLKDKKNEKVVWLSNREREILKYIADGCTTKEMAKLIYRTSETVRTYRRNLLIKLNARNTAELVKKGYQMNLIH
jgi:DNA-binding NarL/FixJ family response regulator